MYTKEQIAQAVSNLRPVSIPVDRKYWFIRTDGGLYFPEFTALGFAALGPQSVSLSDIRLLARIRQGLALAKADLDRARANYKRQTASHKAHRKAYKEIWEQARAAESSLHARLKVAIKLADPDHGAPGKLLEQKMQFVNDIKIGDAIVSPSANGLTVAMGVVTSSAEDVFDNMDSPSTRISVDWVVRSERRDLDGSLKSRLTTQSALTSLQPFADTIDRLMYDFYNKDGYDYFTILVGRKEHVDHKTFFAMALVTDSMDVAGIKIGAEKINVQSEGWKQTAAIGGTGVAAIAMLTVFLFGGEVKVSVGSEAVETNVDIALTSKGAVESATDYLHNQTDRQRQKVIDGLILGGVTLPDSIRLQLQQQGVKLPPVAPLDSTQVPIVRVDTTNQDTE